MYRNVSLPPLCLLLSLLANPLFADEINKQTPGYADHDPKRHIREVRAFTDADAQSLPPPGAILCIGSSSMRLWNSDIAKDLAPLTVIPRGFGGSNMNDVIHYMDRIVLPYKPRAIVLYEGDNDIAGGVTPEHFRDTFLEFVNRVHHRLPGTRIYVLAIKPSIYRWNLWPQMHAANLLLAETCEQHADLTFVDTTGVMLDPKTGKPRQNLFIHDNLHMNREGYLLWRDLLKPLLLQQELRFETQP